MKLPIYSTDQSLNRKQPYSVNTDRWKPSKTILDLREPKIVSEGRINVKVRYDTSKTILRKKA
jgi:hypothetical protein